MKEIIRDAMKGIVSAGAFLFWLSSIVYLAVVTATAVDEARAGDSESLIILGISFAIATILVAVAVSVFEGRAARKAKAEDAERNAEFEAAMADLRQKLSR